MKKRALREFARLGQSGSVYQKQLQDPIRRNDAAMAIDFNDVFSGESLWRKHQGNHHFVNVLMGFRIDNMPIVYRMTFRLRQVLARKDFLRN